MAAYIIFDVEIHDRERHQEFMTQVKPALAEAGGRSLARGGLAGCRTDGERRRYGHRIAGERLGW